MPGQTDTRERLDPRFFATLLRASVIDRLQNLRLYFTRNTMMGLMDKTYLSPYYILEPDSAPMLETLALEYTTYEDDAGLPNRFWFLTRKTTDMLKLRELRLVQFPRQVGALTKLSVDCLRWPMDVVEEKSDARTNTHEKN